MNGPIGTDERRGRVGVAVAAAAAECDCGLGAVLSGLKRMGEMM